MVLVNTGDDDRLTTTIDAVCAAFGGKLVVPDTIRDQRKTALRLLYTPLVRPALRRLLGVTVRAQEAQIFWPIIGVDAVVVVKDQIEWLAVPHERAGIKLAFGNITPLWHQWVLLLPPRQIVPTQSVRVSAILLVTKDWIIRHLFGSDLLPPIARELPTKLDVARPCAPAVAATILVPSRLFSV